MYMPSSQWPPLHSPITTAPHPGLERHRTTTLEYNLLIINHELDRVEILLGEVDSMGPRLWWGQRIVSLDKVSRRLERFAGQLGGD